MEPTDIRLKRLRIRSWRRGTKEMDLLLGGYADGPLHRADAAALDAYEALLEENDNDLYDWISGAAVPDPAHADMVRRIQTFHKIDQ